ncbi:ABC transporter substrate-binding protein [Clostridium chromiireducens]|uniref:Maltose ABC transporter periplasmic protein n=1 Tax=Clostridium chromiireducens TaxID=225345 RepID=A0A1V4IKK7_9CLOT|nr:extracellular solute-binding protein [Clostridium chromiireducens]OPJ60364.1 maltose ABC transporter periplasmic protein [Clostridium chromiireducens]
MKIKKILAATLTATLFSSAMIGCGGSTSVSTTDSSKNDGAGKTINVFQMKVEINDALQQLAKKYEEETGVKVNVTSVGGGADYGASLKAEFQKETEPDIFVVQGAGDYTTYKDKIDDLSSEPWVKNAVKGTLDSLTVDGKIYAMPAATEGYGIMYNKEILDKAGIDPKSIDTFDKLKAAFETLDSKKAELGLDNVISYTTKETWVTGMHSFNIPLAAQKDARQFTKDYIAGKVNVTTNEQFKNWMNLIELFVKYGGGKALDTIDYSTQVGNFALGKTAFMQQGNWTASDLGNLGADFDKGFIPMCINNDPAVSGSIPVGVPMYWAINKGSSVNKEARDFLNWMVTSQTGQEALVKDMNMIPAFTNFTVESDNPLNKSINEYNKAGKTIPWCFSDLPDGFALDSIAPIFSTYAGSDLGDGAKQAMLKSIQEAPAKFKK